MTQRDQAGFLRGDPPTGSQLGPLVVGGGDSPLRTQSEIAYRATTAGGRVAFNITTGVVSTPSTGEQNLAALVNPSGSGMDAYLDVGEFGSSANTTFRRFRGSTVTPTGTPNTPINMSGGSATSALLMYPPAAFTFTGGAVSKSAHIAAYQQYLTNINGKTVLRPGQAVVWTIVGPGGLGGTMTASVYFEYYELAAT